MPDEKYRNIFAYVGFEGVTEVVLTSGIKYRVAH
jgi:hypothetical protein